MAAETSYRANFGFLLFTPVIRTKQHTLKHTLSVLRPNLSQLLGILLLFGMSLLGSGAGFRLRTAGSPEALGELRPERPSFWTSGSFPGDPSSDFRPGPRTHGSHAGHPLSPSRAKESTRFGREWAGVELNSTAHGGPIPRIQQDRVSRSRSLPNPER